jgi:hypothetical protein
MRSTSVWMKLMFLANPSFLLAALAGCGVGAEPVGGPGPVDVQQEIRDSRGRALGDITRAVVLSNADANATLNLLARVEVQDNEIVEIYEPAPGRIILSGAGAPLEGSAVAGMTEQLDLAKFWYQLTGGARMPPQLAAAVSRVEERLLSPVEEVKITPHEAALASTELPGEDHGRMPASERINEATPELLQAGGWCDTSYFTFVPSNASYNKPYGKCDNTWDWTVCLNDWWNGAFANHGDALMAHTNVCPAEGTQVVLRVTSDEFGGGLWTVPVNTVRWYQFYDSACLSIFDDCPSIHSTVEQATNDRFHYRTLVLEE